MSEITPDNTALGIERLRGELREGLAEIRGSLQLLVLRSEQTEKTSAEHAARLDKHDERLDAVEAATQVAASQDVDGRLRQVEKKVWAVSGIVAFVVTAGEILAQLLAH